MKVLCLMPDAFGGRGGIAKFNRDFLSILCAFPGIERVVALPRAVVEPPGPLPEGLEYRAEAAGAGFAGRLRYALALLRALLEAGPIDLIVCGHINLVLLAWVCKRRWGAPTVLTIHGIEAWAPTTRAATNRLVGGTDRVISVSDFTRRRFCAWSDIPPERVAILPNAVDLARFGPGPADPGLVARYGIEGRKVILTVARLAGRERQKGFDEVLEALPALARKVPELAYLIVGDGNDRSRLEAKANALGIADRVVFAGYVGDAEKAAHYRLADAFVMPGRGEGFGIVYLEALATGLPVVGSTADASRELLGDGALGILVDPADPMDVEAGILEALSRPKGTVSEALAQYSDAAFRDRLHAILESILRPAD